MNAREKSPPDFSLLTVVLILMGLGLVTIYSSSAIYALDKFGSSTYFLWRELIWIAFGMAATFFFLLYDYRKLRAWVKPLLLVCLAALVMVLIFGREVNGAKRWLRLGPVGFQPSELAKLALVLFVADYCDRKRSKLQNFQRGILPLLAVLALFCGLIFVQHDLGTPILIVCVCLTVAFVAGVRMSQLSWMGAAMFVFGAAAVWAEPYRRRRLLAFLSPQENAQGAGYQLYQSLLALGSGGLTGVGLGESHSKLLYLPEPHTDFVFPIYGEEFGLMGSWILLGLFGVVAWCGFRISSRTGNLFGSLLACGITLMVLYQAILNIAVVTGCLPTKGLPLPFLSFGGSSLVITMSAMGILLNISRQAKVA